jgi:hypothetical protein
LISSFSVGLLVPIPILPVLLILNRSDPAVDKFIVFAPEDQKPRLGAVLLLSCPAYSIGAPPTDDEMGEDTAAKVGSSIMVASKKSL